MAQRAQRFVVGRRRACAVVAVCALGALATGCSNRPSLWNGPANTGGGSVGVFRTEEVLAYDASPMALADAERFEFSRRDASLNPVTFGPLVASLQWPQAPKPAERRIRFFLWEQR